MDAGPHARADGDLLPGRGARVSLVDLEKRFEGVGAVRGISLEIGSGEFLTLLGPSGSGKTTTLMMIAGFEEPSSGDIAIDGRSVVGVPAHRRNIGMVFQSYALFPHLTVAENIAFPLKQRGIDKVTRTRMVRDSLQMVRLPGYEARYPRQLSGGQQQRVALARAIVFRPRLLLMDEPLGALDKQLRESLQLEMRRLHADLGITFVYVTHDQEEALTMSDRIAVVNEGRIAQLGRPEELYDRPCDRFVASFIGESNFLAATASGIDGGTVAADCAGTILHGLANGPVVPGTPITFTVRPERLRFADAALARQGAPGWGPNRSVSLGPVNPEMPAPTYENRIRVTVTEAVFAGERCRYLLRTPDGTVIVLKEPSGAGVRRRQTGEAAEITWSIADTAVVNG